MAERQFLIQISATSPSVSSFWWQRSVSDFYSGAIKRNRTKLALFFLNIKKKWKLLILYIYIFIYKKNRMKEMKESSSSFFSRLTVKVAMYYKIQYYTGRIKVLSIVLKEINFKDPVLILLLPVPLEQFQQIQQQKAYKCLFLI